MSFSVDSMCMVCRTVRKVAFHSSRRTLKCATCGVATEHWMLPPDFTDVAASAELTPVDRLAAVGLRLIVVEGLGSDAVLSLSAGILLLDQGLPLDDIEDIIDQALKRARQDT